MGKKKNGEVYPLLTTDWLGTPTYRQKPLARNIRQDDDEKDEDYDEYEDDDQVFDMIDHKKKRNVNLVWHDVFLLCMDYIQIFALIQSMSTRWTFPETWLRRTYYLFALNADVWEFKKFHDENIYNSVQGYNMASSLISISYKDICIGWFAASAGLLALYGVVHFVMKCRFYPQQWARRLMSWIQFGAVFLVHIATLPLGTALFRIFHCEGEFNKVFTMNENDCFSTNHWTLAAPAIIYIIVVFLCYPAFLVWKIRQEGMTGTSKGYLSFILLKETEYKIHLNRTWLNDSMWIFSSYKHRGRYYKTAMQIVKLVLLIIFASGFNNIALQAMLTTIFLLLCFLAAVVIRPFRLTSCNAFFIFSLLCNLGSAFLGALVAAYDTTTIPSAWLTPGYVFWFLAIVQSCWAVSLAALMVYLVSRTFCHSGKCCYKRPVWPNIASSGSGRLTAETKKFMTAIIKAKITLEKMQRVPAMFAPVHELSRHIQIINTYTREAEYTQDAMHMVLWETLDDMVEAHAKMAPTSLFAESVKKSIRKTAADFMKLVPMFSQRLAQRDYDMILIPPHKKRILLKMYILGLFLNGRSEKVARKKLLEPATDKVWPRLAADRQYEEEDGYYEDLYPAPIGDNYGSDLLNVIVDDSTDAESTEEEDNVQGMLRNLPEARLIQPEVQLFELETEVVDNQHNDGDDDDQTTGPHPKSSVSFGHVTSSDKQTPRPISATSSKSSSSSSSSSSRSTVTSAGNKRPASASSSLFGSHASLRHDSGRTLSPPLAGQEPSGRSLSPTQGRDRPTSAGSSHSGRGRSPTGRPASGSSVVSSLPSRPGSADNLGDQGLANINPGYVPDPDEAGGGSGEGGTMQGMTGDNRGYVDDETDGNTSDVTMATTATEESGKKKKKKSKKKKPKKSD